MKNIIILEVAESDIATSINWISENFSHDHSLKVLQEIFLQLDRLNDGNILHAKAYGEFRKVVLRKYKYSIFYKIVEENIYIYAVLSQRRDIENILKNR